MRLLAVLLAACLLSTGCSSEAKRQPTSVSAAPTPIEQLNTASMRLARVRFCSLVPEVAVRDALGGRSSKATSWRNGDKASVEGDVDDVVNEDGCAWSRGESRASAWMFGRSVTAAEAQTLVAAAAQQGCRATSGTTFGDPGQRQACRLPDGSRRVRVSGLFGDTWLSCELTAPEGTPATEVRSRTDAWCVQVANAVNTTR